MRRIFFLLLFPTIITQIARNVLAYFSTSNVSNNTKERKTGEKFFFLPFARKGLTYIIFLFRTVDDPNKDDDCSFDLIVAMLFDIASQQQLPEVFTANHNHHCSHKRSSTTINTASSSSAMTNGQRYVVSRASAKERTFDLSFRLMTLVKKQIKFSDMLPPWLIIVDNQVLISPVNVRFDWTSRNYPLLRNTNENFLF